MRKWTVHTPDGVTDLMPDTCAVKRCLEQKLRDLFWLRGYKEIETPSIEFYDVYAAGAGAVPQDELFKLFDQQGRILCLRYDGTVPAARMAATMMQEPFSPLRLFYIGNMFRFNEFGGGRQREFAQAGIELIGWKSPEADAEIIAAAIASAKACGIEDIQISLGQVEFFRAVLEKWQISGDDAKIISEVINKKETLALEEHFDRLAIAEEARPVLRLLAAGDGSFRQLDDLGKMVQHPLAAAALDNLRQVMAILQDYDYLKYITLDLGMLQSLNYYTGIIFKGFTYGIGFPLFSGGRYDRLVKKFGKDIPATGFSLGINLALAALGRQNRLPAASDQTIMLGYAEADRVKAVQTAEALRNQGKKLICVCTEKQAGDFLDLWNGREDIRPCFMQSDKSLIWPRGGEETCSN